MFKITSKLSLLNINLIGKFHLLVINSLFFLVNILEEYFYMF